MPGCVVRMAERLGRRIFSERVAARAHRGRVLPKVFDSDDVLISVDRLSTASLDVVEQVVRNTSGDRADSFQGWAVVICAKVRAAGLRVRASPRIDNPYHADTVLPPAATNDREFRKKQAQELAKIAGWQPSSTWVPPST